MELWILVFLLVVVQPLLGWWRFRSYLGREPVVPTPRKLRFYGMIVLTQWTLMLLCAWVLSRRHLNIAELGLLAPGPPWAWAAAVTLGVVLIGATFVAVRNLRKSARDEFPPHLARMSRILPLLPIERAAFTPVALTAGICEETLYRGFLTYAFLQVTHSMPAALALGTLAFGFGHIYQGPRGVVSTALLGAFLASIYWGAGSLWPGIALHAAIDLVNGNVLGSLSRLTLTPAKPDAHTDASTSESIPPLERTTGT